MVCDPLEHVTQVAFRVQIVEFRAAEAAQLRKTAGDLF
jgi:hypothetical protein